MNNYFPVFFPNLLSSYFNMFHLPYINRGINISKKAQFFRENFNTLYFNPLLLKMNNYFPVFFPNLPSSYFNMFHLPYINRGINISKKAQFFRENFNTLYFNPLLLKTNNYFPIFFPNLLSSYFNMFHLPYINQI